MINKKYKDVRIAIIGGTGVYDPKLLTDVDQLRVYTPYGSPSDLITVGVYAGTKIAFLPRHGVNHLNFFCLFLLLGAHKASQ